MLERSLEILRPLNEPRVLVESITFLGVVMELTGNYARALELYAEGLEIATAIGDRWFAALCLICLAGLVGITQSVVKPENTHERLQSAVADWRAIGDPRFTAIGLNILSQSALRLGRYDEARAALEESVALRYRSAIAGGWVLPIGDSASSRRRKVSINRQWTCSAKAWTRSPNSGAPGCGACARRDGPKHFRAGK